MNRFVEFVNIDSNDTLFWRCRGQSCDKTH